MNEPKLSQQWPTIALHSKRLKALEELVTALTLEVAALRRQLAAMDGDGR